MDIEGVKCDTLMHNPDGRGSLAELWRVDELGYQPMMIYVSTTNPGKQRGPHEHRKQTDMFYFSGYVNLYLWDNRPDSPTFGNTAVVRAGGMRITVPPGVVHAYKNYGPDIVTVVNMPDQLYKGHGKCLEVDEIRHEDDPETEFIVG